MTTALAAPPKIDSQIIDALNTEFGGFRARIAALSVGACDSFVDMFNPLAPVMDAHVTKIAWDQIELAVVPDAAAPAPHSVAA